MSNLIIVESENDKYFIEAMIENLNLNDIEVGSPICVVDDYECLNGYTNLTNRLKEIKFDKHRKIGIVLDADDKGIEARIEYINTALKEVCSDLEIEMVNTLYPSKELEVDIACYITNVAGKGELETLLKEIKSKDSVYADCLDSWKECLEAEGKTIKQKDFDKFWVSNYIRFDTCSSNEKKQAHRKCSIEAAMKKNIWDFSDSKLDELKKFLNLFV